VALFEGFTTVKGRILGIKRGQALLVVAFSLFLLMRFVPWPNWLPVPAKYADADLYVTAGQALVRGALPDSINQAHPPLAKYIIGVFSVYFNSPNGSSLVFGLLTAIVAFLIARRFAGNTLWGAVTVWIMAFDQVNISLSIRPMLDIFMIFFAVVGFYLIVTTDEGMLRYCVAGLSLGFAVACKLNGALFLIPALVILVFERRLKETTGLLVSAIIAYVSSYFQLLLTKGVDGLLNAQVLMLNFGVEPHVSGENLSPLTRVLTPLIVHTSTLAPTGYALCPPNVLGLPFSSIAETVNAPLLLLSFPILYWLVRHRHTSSPQRQRTIRLLIATVVGCLFYEAAFPFTIGVWYFAPFGTVLAISAPAMFKELQGKRVTAYSTYLYLIAATTWLVFANAIYLSCGVP
jgi:hypothetical protein